MKKLEIIYESPSVRYFAWETRVSILQPSAGQGNEHLEDGDTTGW